MVTLALAGDNTPPLMDETDRISYAIGHQIGSDFKRQQVDLDTQAVIRGMEDGHQARSPLIDPKEMNRRLVDLKRNITGDVKAEALERMQQREADRKHKRQRGTEFLAQNAEKPGIITTESGMQYRIIASGEGVSPKLTDRVRIHYTSSRLDGQVINSSRLKGGPRVFPVNGLIAGVTEALRLMRPGDKWELYLPSNLAYGRQGPFAHEVIITEVELLEILRPETVQAKPSQEESERQTEGGGNGIQ